MRVLGTKNKDKVFVNTSNKVLQSPYQNPQNWAQIMEHLNRGMLQDTLPVGSTIDDSWDVYTTTWDVVHHVSNASYNKVMLNWHYTIPDAVAYDAPEAIYYARDGLVAGTYHIKIGVGWGDGWVKDESIQFTLSKDVPVGGQIFVDCGQSNSVNPTAGRSVRTYAVRGGTTVIETTTTSNGTAGTELGSTSSASVYRTNGLINSAARIIYGYNRWSQSAIRQYLNSTATKGNWWTPQNEWDRPTAQTTTLDGFLSKFSSEFLAVLKPVAINTALNTVEGLAETYETTYDRIFLPSLQEMYITPQLAGVEGEDWDYYKVLAAQAGLTGRFAWSTSYEVLKRYPLSNKSSAVTCWLRSAYRSQSHYAWFVNSSGYVSASTAYYAYCACPTCILQSDQSINRGAHSAPASQV